MRISDWSSDVCSSDLDLADVRGQAVARRALEIAAAGNHHLLLIGPPGCGKTMLASRLAGVLPPAADEDALEDRKSVVSGKSVSVRVDLGGRRIVKKKCIIT